jgi:dUTP pyrophosphatase
MQVQVKYHTDAAGPLSQAHPGEWVDLRTAVDTNISAGHRMMISLGVSIKLPDGYEAIMAPRSSTFKEWGILQTNSIGVIDAAYCGDDDVWHFPAYATRDITIPAGARIAQFRLLPVQGQILIEEVDNMANASRGGLGSTGKF